MFTTTNTKILQVVIAILALADGVLHFSLDFVLFRGNFFGTGRPAGPPPGAPGRTGPAPRAGGNPFILPLNELFLLNFLGEVVLVGLFWFGDRWLGRKRWLIDVAMIAFAAATFIGWWMIGRPNPMGLGYLSKSIEVVLIVSLIAHMWTILRPQRIVAPKPA